jgi:hypothetical protein
LALLNSEENFADSEFIRFQRLSVAIGRFAGTLGGTLSLPSSKKTVSRGAKLEWMKVDHWLSSGTRYCDHCNVHRDDRDDFDERSHLAKADPTLGLPTLVLSQAPIFSNRSAHGMK